MRKLIFFALICSLTFDVNACIFQSDNKDGSSPFWNSTRIEVCFLPALPRSPTEGQAPNALDSEYLSIYNRNKALIRRTFESQFNMRAGFDMHGFNTCNPNDRTQKVRIDLNGFGGGIGAVASSIGPLSSTRSANIDIVTANSDWEAGFTKPFDPENMPERIRTFNSADHISWVSLHETMHLLGLHHSEHWDQDMSTADPNINRAIQFGGGMDSDSIMTRGATPRMVGGIAQLSTRDAQCLTHISNRSIMQFPQRRAAGVINQITRQPATQVPTTKNPQPNFISNTVE
jgi:hypothetical protein